MKEISQLNEWIENVDAFVDDLQKANSYKFNIVINEPTKFGEDLELGFSTYGLKLSYMLGKWKKLDIKEQNKWINFLISFQTTKFKGYENYFIDENYVKHFKKINFKETPKDLVKLTLNQFTKNKYDTKNIKLQKGINAENKQTIATLHEVGVNNYKNIKKIDNNSNELEKYLNSLNWSKPWTSGAQFASLCLYSVTQGFQNESKLIKFIEGISDERTGSYFSELPKEPREIINGAMKVISGLDWLEEKIHYPEKLIDFCINNKPKHEGCDVVDYIYVLTKCSKQTNYKKEAVARILVECISVLSVLYSEKEGGFSYFVNSSQTHYYGVEVSKGKKEADLHGTLLCTWAIIMILDFFEELDAKFNLIKP